MVTSTQPALSPALIEALALASLPDGVWTNQDDKCDCVYQRIYQTRNIYLAETHEIRLCCIWAELGKQWPQFVRTTPGYWEPNNKEWITQPQEWDGETEMPKSIWYRHLARKLGRSVADIRAEYTLRDDERPKGRGPRLPFLLPMGGDEWAQVNLASHRKLDAKASL